MTDFTIEFYDHNKRQLIQQHVQNPENANEALNRILNTVTDAHRTMVYKTNREGNEPLIELFWGDSAQAGLIYAAEDGGAAVEDGVFFPEGLGYDYDILPARWSQLTPAKARKAVLEYIATDGGRPTCVRFVNMFPDAEEAA